MRTTTLLLLSALVAAGPAGAQSYFFSPDVPTDLGGSTYLPWQVVRNDGGSYQTELTLPAGAEIDGLHAMDAGDWLVSLEAPTTLGGTTYDPVDVIRTDGATYSSYFCGETVGIPAGSNVDAVLIAGGDSGLLGISFDVPTDLSALGGAVVEPADVAGFQSTGPACDDWALVALAFDGSASGAGVPLSDNVTGAAVLGGSTLIGLDVPSTLGPTFLPGEVVEWDGASFSSFAFDAGWPIGSRLDALAGLGNAGLVPPTLTIGKSTITPGDLTLSWQASCSAAGEDYGIYQGTIASIQGGVYNHQSIDCSDNGGDLTEEVNPAAGSRYYLVVPNNSGSEGSYGLSFDGTTAERPAGSSSCQAGQQIAACPP